MMTNPMMDQEAGPPYILTVTDQDQGLRLDRFLAGRLPFLSRNLLQESIRQGKVRAGEAVALSQKEKVQEGQVYWVMPVMSEPQDLTPEPMDFHIYHEDDHILVLEKPAGIVVHPGNGHHEQTLVHGLLYHCQSLSVQGGAQRPGLVHRLDQLTSGLMVVAKTDEAHFALSQQFAQRTIQKEYDAFVWGAPMPPSGTIRTLLARDPRNPLRQIVSMYKGKEAVTHYRTVRRWTQYSLLRCRIETGRTHQIRVHCQHMGMPILGDAVYKKQGTPSTSLARQALHACFLAFQHPVSKDYMSFTSPLPPDLQDLLEKD